MSKQIARWILRHEIRIYEMEIEFLTQSSNEWRKLCDDIVMCIGVKIHKLITAGHPLMPAPSRKKVNYVGAPAVFALEQACQNICDAFDGYGCYLVGSALERPDWRDVDVRFIMSDERFDAQFPGARPCWEQDAKWLLLIVSISAWLTKVTGLPVDFQIQPQSHANERHDGPRHAIGIRVAKSKEL